MSAAVIDDGEAPRLPLPPAVEGALALVAAGYFVAPVTVRRNPETGRKMPTYHGQWGKISTDRPERVLDWYATHGDALGFAVDCERSGIVVIDLDVKPEHGIDAVREWAAESRSFGGGMLINTPGGGAHLYWRQRDGQVVRNSEGKIALGTDVRGAGGHTYAPGTSVVGEPERPWQVQGVIAPAADLDRLPDDVYDAIPTGYRTRERDTSARSFGETHEVGWIELEIVRQRRRVGEFDTDAGGGFRAALRGAAMMHGRAVTAGIISRERAERLLRKSVAIAWDAPADEDDEQWIATGLDDGEADPWTVVEDGSEAPALGIVQEDDDAPDRTPFEVAVRKRLDELRVREEADRRVRVERNAHRPRIADGLIDDLDEIERPAMLLGSLIPERGIGFLAGRSGSYKSFLATSWACCIATGRAWLGRDEFAVSRPLRGLYVAAEGAGGVAARIKAWEAENGVSRSGRLFVYPRPIHLNDEAQVDELVEVVVAREIEFVTIDTYHRSAPGVEENSATDFGPIFEAAARLRDDHGVAVLFVDHTGHGGERLRGTSAKGDDADYVLTSSYEGQERGPEIARTLAVSKLKDEETTGRWSIALRKLDGHYPVPVVVEPDGDDEGRALLVAPSEWWVSVPDMGDAEIERLVATSDRGRGVPAAQAAWRVLSTVDAGEGNEQGLTVTQLRDMVNEAPGFAFARSTFRFGVGLLVEAKFAYREKDRIYLEARRQ